jgi:23S rRNA pseudouridine1911/1915/1917 synthase
MTLVARQFFERTIHRRYVALVWGNVAEDQGTIEGAIGRDPRDRQAFRVFPDGSQGKPAITHYKVLERFGFVTLVECRLETGRTHQIRVHLKYLGHTLFNDPRYGGQQVLKGIDSAKYKLFVQHLMALIPGQALHAKALGFVHPFTGEDLYFETPVPVGFSQILERWRTFMAGHLGPVHL